MIYLERSVWMFEPMRTLDAQVIHEYFAQSEKKKSGLLMKFDEVTFNGITCVLYDSQAYKFVIKL